MASYQQYLELGMLPQNPTEEQKEAAKTAFDRTSAGDNADLPPPFTYGKLWINDEAVEKLRTAPDLPRSDLEQLLTGGSAALPNPRTFTQKATDYLRRRRSNNEILDLGSRVHARSVINETRARKEATSFKLLVEITTSITGSRVIFYSTRLTGKIPPELPTIPRETGEAPYARERDKKNKKWNHISKELGKWLKSHFHPGNQLTLPNPVYPDNLERDTIFRISDFNWEYLPEKYDILTGKNKPFKFFITDNFAKDDERDLYIFLKVGLTGGKETILKPDLLQPKKIPETNGVDTAASYCNTQLMGLTTIIRDKFNAISILSDSDSKTFEKKMKNATTSDIVSKNIVLYYKNRNKAIEFWMQEYYCRQADNYKTGVNAGWPTTPHSRFPFDPWTLQPAVAATSRIPPAVNQQNIIDSYADDRPPWPLPFSPLGMSLKPKMVIILFKRMNKLINNFRADGAPLLPARIGADLIARLRTLLISGKLIKLERIVATNEVVRNYPDPVAGIQNTQRVWNDIFIIYEYLLYHNYLVQEYPQDVLEPYAPYPKLPEPEPVFGIWRIGGNGAYKQYAIPVTNIPNWPSVDDTPPYVQPFPEQVARPRVSWQQIKKNGFYRIEAKKWAEWMVLVNPFPIPGFPRYSDYLMILQNYKYSKLSGSSSMPVPNAALIGNQSETQVPLPDEDTEFSNGTRQWILPSAAARTAQYINPYAPVATPDVPIPPGAAPAPWMPPHFLHLLSDEPNFQKWMYTGPKATEYPVEIWPKDKWRTVDTPPLEEMSIENVRTVENDNLSKWVGGKKTFRKKTFRKKTFRKSLNKRNKKTIRRKSFTPLNI